MKKILSMLLGLSLASTATSHAKDNIVSIDSLSIMQKSEQGKELTAKVQKDIEAFQKDVQKVQKELAELQESIAKQAKALSKDALEAKNDELNAKRKTMEHEFSVKEEALRSRIQKQQITLRDQQLAVITKWTDKEKPVAVLDKNTPGLLFVSNAIDKTEEVLKFVNQDYATAKTAPKADVAKATVKQA
jgi:outer membrane protein